jgi:hypothetical protein
LPTATPGMLKLTNAVMSGCFGWFGEGGTCGGTGGTGVSNFLTFYFG